MTQRQILTIKAVEEQACKVGMDILRVIMADEFIGVLEIGRYKSSAVDRNEVGSAVDRVDMNGRDIWGIVGWWFNTILTQY